MTQLVWSASCAAAAAFCVVLAYQFRVRRGRFVLRRSMLRPLVLTDEHWRLICAQEDFTDFQPHDFGDLEDVLVAAQNALAYLPAAEPAVLPQLADIGLWDTTDDNNWDFHMTVDVNPVVRVASQTTKVSYFTGLGQGPAAARAVLQELIDDRNRLIAGIASAIPA